VITDHRYDASWPRNDTGGCVHAVYRGDGTYEPNCGRTLEEHVWSEYPEDNERCRVVARDLETRGVRFPTREDFYREYADTHGFTPDWRDVQP
jgi:hypothetical protein